MTAWFAFLGIVDRSVKGPDVRAPGWRRTTQRSKHGAFDLAVSARRHRTYRLRIMIGAVLQGGSLGDPGRRAHLIRRGTGASDVCIVCSAWAAKRDLGIVAANPGSGGRMGRAGNGA